MLVKMSPNIIKQKKYLIPIAIYLCFIMAYTGYSAVKNNNFLYQPVWDVGHYLTISETGYEVLPCTDASGKPTGGICGNVGWYPAWPIVTALVRPIVGGSSQLAFSGLAFMFSFLLFLLLFELMNRLYDGKTATLAVLALAASPAAFYLITGFPYALMLTLLFLYLLLLYNQHSPKRDIGLFITALAISLCYPSGILYAIIPFIWYIRTEREKNEKSIRIYYWLHLIKYIAPFILGPLLLWTYFYFKFDNFFLQLHFQEKFGRTWDFPLSVIFRGLTGYSLLIPENVTVLWYGLIFLLFHPYKTKAELWIMAAFLFLFSPATGTLMSIYRHYLIIFPAYMIIGTSVRPVWMKIGFIAVGLIISMTILFPKFIAYRLV